MKLTEKNLIDFQECLETDQQGVTNLNIQIFNAGFKCQINDSMDSNNNQFNTLYFIPEVNDSRVVIFWHPVII